MASACGKRQSESRRFCLSPHNFSHTTCANIAHEEAEQIRARIVCTPAEKGGRAWMEYVRRRNKEITHYGHLIRQPTAATFYPCLGDADRVCSANRSIPHWRRLARCPCFLKIKSRISTLGSIASIQSAFMCLISLLQWEKVARFTATDEVLL